VSGSFPQYRGADTQAKVLAKSKVGASLCFTGVPLISIVWRLLGEDQLNEWKTSCSRECKQ
jgi:hypothetical protein